MQLYWETLQIFLALFGLEFMFVVSFDRRLLLVPLVKPNPKERPQRSRLPWGTFISYSSIGFGEPLTKHP